MNLQKFAYDNNAYCDFTSTAAKAIAGKDILLCVYNETGDDLLAISGQQGLTINRSADSIEITSKDTQGGWKSKIAGMKEWSIDNDGIYALGDESHTVLSKAFENSDPVCIKVIDSKRKRGKPAERKIYSNVKPRFKNTGNSTGTFIRNASGRNVWRTKRRAAGDAETYTGILQKYV